MEDLNLTDKQVVRFLKKAKRMWDTYETPDEKFIERKNNVNPLVITLNRSTTPNTVVTIRRQRDSQLDYTLHALQRMEERNITDEEVYRVFKKGKKIHGDKDETVKIVEKQSINPLTIVVPKRASNKIITVYRKLPQ
jgi:hypothetical protein